MNKRLIFIASLAFLASAMPLRGDNPFTGFCVGGKEFSLRKDTFTKLELKVKSLKRNGQVILSGDSTVLFPTGSPVGLAALGAAELVQMSAEDSASGIGEFTFRVPGDRKIVATFVKGQP